MFIYEKESASLSIGDSTYHAFASWSCSCENEPELSYGGGGSGGLNLVSAPSSIGSPITWRNFNCITFILQDKLLFFNG